MEQLLDVKIVPISFELKVHNAKLEMSSDSPAQQGILDYRNLTPYTTRLHIDTHQYSNKTILKAVSPTAQNTIQNDVLSSLNTTNKIVKEGNLLMKSQDNSITLGSLAFQHAQPTLGTTIGIPSMPTNFNWDSQQLSVQYEADRQNYDWLSQNKQKLTFTPASVEFIVKEYAHVEFTFLGKPQYVPPSASPDYVPPQLDVTA